MSPPAGDRDGGDAGQPDEDAASLTTSVGGAS